MRHGWPALLACSCLLLFAAPASAQVAAGTKTLTDGQVTATLTWQKGEIFAEHPALQITRAGAVAFDGKLEDRCKACNYLADADSALQVRDLDGDGEPEVLVDTFSGGAHCCTITPIFRWDGVGGVGYRRLTRNFGDIGYSLKDLDGDGRPEFVTADDAFAYEFTAYAFDEFPLQIFAYGTDRSGKTALRDVTAGYPKMVSPSFSSSCKSNSPRHISRTSSPRTWTPNDTFALAHAPLSTLAPTAFSASTRILAFRKRLRTE